MNGGQPIVADLEGLLASDRALGLAGVDAELHAIEDARRQLAAREARALGLADEYRLYAQDSHATMWGYLRADLGWSESECRRRMRVARLVREFPEVGEALADGRVPVAAVDEIARGFANPRCGARLGEVLGEILNVAASGEHDDVKLVVDRWIAVADVDGAQREADKFRDQRNAIVSMFGGEGTLIARLTEADAKEVDDIVAHFADAEFRTDWEAAKAVYGDDVCKALLARTDAQRRADAVMTIFRTAAAAPSDVRPAMPGVQLHIDIRTYADHLVKLGLLPGDFTADWPALLLAQRRCETSTGVPVTPHEVFQATMAGHVRRLIVGTGGKILAASSKQRTFRGAAREVVMNQKHRCPHPGCRVSALRSQGDHIDPHSRGGPTAITNGGIGCARHNPERYRRGYTTRRTSSGWHTYRPDGTEIGNEPPVEFT